MFGRVIMDSRAHSRAYVKHLFSISCAREIWIIRSYPSYTCLGCPIFVHVPFDIRPYVQVFSTFCLFVQLKNAVMMVVLEIMSLESWFPRGGFLPVNLLHWRGFSCVVRLLRLWSAVFVDNYSFCVGLFWTEVFFLGQVWTFLLECGWIVLVLFLVRRYMWLLGCCLWMVIVEARSP